MSEEVMKGACVAIIPDSTDMTWQVIASINDQIRILGLAEYLTLTELFKGYEPQQKEGTTETIHFSF